MKKKLLIAFVVLSGILQAQPRTHDWECRLQQLYVEGKSDDWPLLIKEMDAVNDSGIEFSLLSASARYGYIGMLLGQKRKKEAQAELDVLTGELEKILKQNPANTQALSMKAGTIGYRIGISPLKAPYLGPGFGRLIDRAAAINQNCPYVLTEQANSLFFRPAVFGGDKKEALQKWQKAGQLFRLQSKTCNWYALHVRVMIIMAYEELGNRSAAVQQQEKLLIEYPAMKWVVKK